MRHPLLAHSLTLTLVTALAAACSDPQDAAGPDAGTTGSADAGIDAAPGVAPFPCAVGATWARCPDNPLYIPGRPMPDGRLELNVGDPDVQWDPDDRIWKAWWSSGAASSGTATDGVVHLMYAESPDGIAWTVQAEPAMRASTDPAAWDYGRLETPTVVKVASNPPARRYVLFYASGNDLVYPLTDELDFTWYQIGAAYSADGRTFTRMPEAESPYANDLTTGFAKREGLLLFARDAFPAALAAQNGVVADPEVAFVDGQPRLLFSSLATASDRLSFLAYGVSGARLTSLDPPRLEMTPGNPLVAGAAQPSVIQVGSTYELYAVYDSAEDDARMPSVFNPYYGAWLHTSTDLVTFGPRGSQHEVSMAGGPAEERYGWVKAGDMTYADGIRRYYYPSFRSDVAPDGFFCPVRHGSVTPLPAGTIENALPGVDAVPGIITLQVMARR